MPDELPKLDDNTAEYIRTGLTEARKGGRGAGGRGGCGYGRGRGPGGANRDFTTMMMHLSMTMELPWDTRRKETDQLRGVEVMVVLMVFIVEEDTEALVVEKLLMRNALGGFMNAVVALGGGERELKRDGAGRGNWVTATDEITQVTDEPVVENEAVVAAEKQAGAEEIVDVEKENPKKEVEKGEPEEKGLLFSNFHIFLFPLSFLFCLGFHFIVTNFKLQLVPLPKLNLMGIFFDSSSTPRIFLICACEETSNF
ncbi:RGG repeats nuclear RNA binding protein A-like [Amaranthus tricolor]|uniref:RGG repeats nuclear RNA binding protein A-like n=1 Tax=Amaranthus tricolor TaxID=29722 RepID=UPI002582F19D|nr:RGG repeats nuclear RNA binding protein A-like [Amaranthus tricolor]